MPGWKPYQPGKEFQDVVGSLMTEKKEIGEEIARLKAAREWQILGIEFNMTGRFWPIAVKLDIVFRML